MLRWKLHSNLLGEIQDKLVNSNDTTRTEPAFKTQKESCKKDYKIDNTDACIQAVKDLVKKIHEHL